MKHFSHLNTAELILTQYNGAQPFGLFIKDFFKADKKYGSKDRKRITALCYGYFRLGKIAEEYSVKERILLGLFLASTETDGLLELEKPAWNANTGADVESKLELAGLHFTPEKLFPAAAQISSLVDQRSFALSHFIQPDLFLRLRPGKEIQVKESLANAGVSFKEVSSTCLALPNASKLDDIVAVNRDVVIQDLSSQRVTVLLDDVTAFSPGKVWDCCAASGGKSLLIYDRFPGIQLTVSDVRENILANLAKRFREAGITQYKGFVADLSKPVKTDALYDLVMTDVPCTGSGTWGRTPEQLLFFTEQKIGEYARRQRQIILNTWKHLRPGGYFLYITCSVYKQENEEAVAFAIANTKLKLISSSLFQGYEQRADTLFAALFHLEK
jgi:16S rRNA (cytosine967-C5)-methyltransferase